MKNTNALIALSALSILLTPAIGHTAKKPRFTFPVECILGEDCWTVNYVDLDPADGKAIDHKCSNRTYDTHKGTDFALKDHQTMLSGVNVKSVMEGRVLRFRDGETDTVKDEADLKALSSKNRDCGNGILIDHAPAGFQGLQTMYCHLKQGSLKVKEGEIVKAGQTIAQIGHSGFTEFPHLHLSVFWEGGIIDPFTGTLNTQGCKAFKYSMWKDDSITYEPFAIYDGGFEGAVPNFDKIKDGTYNFIKPGKDKNAFLFWTAIYGVEKGDEIMLHVAAPDGSTYVERNLTQDKTRARQFYYSGKRLHEDSTLQSGTYTGTITVTRPGQPQKRKIFKAYID